MKIVIIGCSHAGISCARRAKQEFPDSEVVMYEKKKEVSFISQSIPLYLAGKNNILKHATYTSVEELEAEGIIVYTEKIVRNINVTTKTLDIMPIEETTYERVTYDKLVMATGSYPVLPPIKGELNKDLFIIKNIEDAIALNQLLHKNKRVIVIGGGLIGTEITRIFNQHGSKVTLLQAHNHILNKYLDDIVSSEVEDLLRSEGVDIHLNTLAVNYEIQKKGKISKRDRVIVTTDEYEKYEADGVIISVGFRPNSYLLQTQVILGDMGAIVVDEYMKTSAPDVFAVGDCSTTYLNLLDKNVYIPNASDAIRQGEIAAINLMEEKQKINSTQGTYNFNTYSYTISVTGLTTKFAKKAGFDCDIVQYTNTFLNSNDYTKMFMVYEKKTHKILGLQVMGTVDVSSYVNIFSLAIERGLSIEDVEFTDFYFEHGFKNPEGFTKTLARLVREREGVKVVK
jgi:NADPH-dependent 2,4-dienoyl-CoA reductase/sulfur reductase-like enzyme